MNHLIKTRENVLTIKPDANRKYVVFSDFHRGLSDKADDFNALNKSSYSKALSYYYHAGYTIIHLGDIEELKEQFQIKRVVNHPSNAAILTSEKLFFNDDRLIKVFGNHDSQWQNKAAVKKHLNEHFPNIKVYEGVIIEFEDAPDIILVHGHQSYTWFKSNVLEKVFLPIYRIGLNMFGIRRKVAYDDYCTIEKTENEFYEWIKDQTDLILIFGHTHRPLWGSSTHLEALQRELETKRKELEEIAVKKQITVRKLILSAALYGVGPLVSSVTVLIERIKAKMSESGRCRSPIPLPLLFNTGCCIYEDGDITGIEIAEEKLRLIKWGKEDDQEIKRTILEHGDLSSFALI